MEIIASPAFDVQQLTTFLVLLFIATCVLLIIVVTALVAFFVFSKTKTLKLQSDALKSQMDLDESLAKSMIEDSRHPTKVDGKVSYSFPNAKITETANGGSTDGTA